METEEIMTTATDDVIAWENWREANPVKKWRQKESKTQGMIAAHLDKSVQAVRLWERGENQPSEDAADDLAKMMSVTRETLERRWRVWWEARPSF